MFARVCVYIVNLPHILEIVTFGYGYVRIRLRIRMPCTDSKYTYTQELVMLILEYKSRMDYNIARVEAISPSIFYVFTHFKLRLAVGENKIYDNGG